MKNNKIIALIAGVLLLVALIIYLQQSKGTIKPELKDFAIEDTASISKIFMVNKLNEQVTLEKKEGLWYVNDKYLVRKDAIDLILKTFKRISVKAPVPKAAFNTIVKNLAASNVKIEVYTDASNPEKVFYVGGPTQDYYGTYMMLENSSTPFIMHIPGFAGYLSSRFFLDENEWRDQTICRYRYNQIRSVDVKNFKNPGQSFKAVNLGDNKFELYQTNSNTKANAFDTLFVKQYLAQYKKLSFERFATEVTPEKRDSIIASEPIYTLKLTDTNDKTVEVSAFLRPSASDNEANLEEYPYDLERMYGQINGDSTLVIIQYFTFDPLFLGVDVFLRK